MAALRITCINVTGIESACIGHVSMHRQVGGLCVVSESGPCAASLRPWQDSSGRTVAPLDLQEACSIAQVPLHARPLHHKTCQALVGIAISALIVHALAYQLIDSSLTYSNLVHSLTRALVFQLTLQIVVVAMAVLQ
jgi:hypothetical protein